MSRKLRYWCLSGLSLVQPYFYFNNDLQTAVQALMERVMYEKCESGFQPVTRPATESSVGSYLSKVRGLINMSHGIYLPEAVIGYARRHYTGAKFKVYDRAEKNILRRGLKRTAAYLSSFVKIEKVQPALKRIVARLIQPRSPEYNVMVGRYIHQLEPVIYGIINRIFQSTIPVVQKGFNASQVGENISKAWARFTDPVALSFDASRFDQHINSQLLEWEHSIYLRFFSRNDQKPLAELLRRQIHNKGFIHCHDGDITYTVEGGRCSGDINTSMGNCLLMCSFFYTYWVNLGRRPSEISFINNGDDCCVICERKDAELFDQVPEVFRRELGIIMTVFPPVRQLESICFCQTHVCRVGEGYRLVRNFPECTGKDSLFLKVLNSTTIPMYLRTVGVGGLSIASGVPVLQSFYLCMLRIAGEGKLMPDPVFADSGFMRLARDMPSRAAVVTPAARLSFYYAFGYTPQMQIALEQLYDVIDHMSEFCVDRFQRLLRLNMGSDIPLPKIVD